MTAVCLTCRAVTMATAMDVVSTIYYNNIAVINMIATGELLLLTYFSVLITLLTIHNVCYNVVNNYLSILLALLCADVAKDLEL